MNISYIRTSSVPDQLISAVAERLPLFMRQEILKFKQPSDQKARLLSRLMLLAVLEEDGVGRLIHNWERDPSHKPFIEGWKSFNITHSGELVLLVYDVVPVGIDIEKKAKIEYQDVINLFHSEEQMFIRKSFAPEDAFYDVWVKKEAFLKGIGTGIVNGLNGFSCVNNVVAHDRQNWNLTHVPIDEEYICYVASTVNASYSVREMDIRT